MFFINLKFILSLTFNESILSDEFKKFAVHWISTWFGVEPCDERCVIYSVKAIFYTTMKIRTNKRGTIFV